MYILDRLQNMSILIGNESVDGELATYFVNNVHKLDKMTLQKCMKDTRISKASIHRFYSKAGFINFKNFINVLSEETKGNTERSFNVYKSKMNELINEYDFDQIDNSSIVKRLKKAEQIFIYSNIRDMYSFTSTINYLRSHNKKVVSLNKWEVSISQEILETLKENDVLIIINDTINIQNYHEMSMNNEYLLNIDNIKASSFHKYYIGLGNKNSYLGFEIIKIPDCGEELSFIIMNLLDKYLYQKLSEEK